MRLVHSRGFLLDPLTLAQPYLGLDSLAQCLHRFPIEARFILKEATLLAGLQPGSRSFSFKTPKCPHYEFKQSADSSGCHWSAAKGSSETLCNNLTPRSRSCCSGTRFGFGHSKPCAELLWLWSRASSTAAPRSFIFGFELACPYSGLEFRDALFLSRWASRSAPTWFAHLSYSKSPESSIVPEGWSHLLHQTKRCRLVTDSSRTLDWGTGFSRRPPPRSGPKNCLGWVP